MNAISSTYGTQSSNDYSVRRQSGNQNGGTDGSVSPVEQSRQRSREAGGAAAERQRGLQLSAADEKTGTYGPTGRALSVGSTNIHSNQKRDPAAAQPSEDPQLQAAVAQLKAIEEKVKAHEAAHKAAGGTMTGPVSYSYTRGPDGRNYITGGEVPIAISPGKTPQETVSRMQQVIQAALAPADPSPQDRAVAAQAAAQQQQASQQMAAQAAGAPDGNAAAAADSETALPAIPSENIPTADNPKSGEQPAAGPGERPGFSDLATVRYSQRAYSDPAVSGRPETATEATPRNDPRAHAVSLSGVIRSSLATMTPAAITGFDAWQPRSFHA